MKRIAMLLFGLALSVPAFAWNCSDPLAERVVVPSGTSGSYGDADGQLALYNGALYECKVVPVTPPQRRAQRLIRPTAPLCNVHVYVGCECHRRQQQRDRRQFIVQEWG